MRRRVLRGLRARWVAMSRAKGLSLAAVINRSDLGDDRVRQYLDAEHIEVVAEIPFMGDVARAYARGEIAAHASRPFRERIARIAAWLVPEEES